MNTAQGLFSAFLTILNLYVVPIIFALAFIMFLFGVYRYFIAGGANPEKVQEGQKFVLWSIVGFVVMFSIWGIINLFVNTLGFSSNNQPPLPSFGNTTSGASGSYTAPYTGSFGTAGGGSTNYNPTNTVTSSSNCGSFDTSTGAYGTICSSGYSCVNNQCVLNAGTDPNASTAQCGSFNDYDCPDGQSCNSSGMCGSGSDSSASVGQTCTDNTVAPVGGSCYNCGNGVTTANGADCPASTVYTACTDDTASASGCYTCQSGVTTSVAANCSENGGDE